MKTKHHIETTIEISAPVEQVWKVLTNLGAYENWNPFIIRSEGSIAKGNQLINTVKNGEKTMTFKPKVTNVELNHSFEWLGHLYIPRLFDGTHYFILTKLENGSTLLTHGEYFRGLLAGMILSSIREDTLNGFKSMNQALKKQVENGTTI